MIQTTLPLVFTILGILLLLAGLLLSLLIGRRHRLDTQPAYVDDRHDNRHDDPVFGTSDPDEDTTRRGDLHGR